MEGGLQDREGRPGVEEEDIPFHLQQSGWALLSTSTVQGGSW
jgi:hypothetical protein